MKIFLHWLPFAIVTTLLSGLIYSAVQQNIRMSANDPQVQIAEDAAARLSSGIMPSSIVPQGNIDVAKSLAPFIIVFDDSGKVLASLASLDGKPPILSAGVFSYTRTHGEDRLTWQPKAGVRLATIVTRFSATSTASQPGQGLAPRSADFSGFVVVGRSMKEIENRIGQLSMFTLVAWLATMILTLLASWFLHRHVKQS